MGVPAAIPLDFSAVYTSIFTFQILLCVSFMSFAVLEMAIKFQTRLPLAKKTKKIFFFYVHVYVIRPKISAHLLPQDICFRVIFAFSKRFDHMHVKLHECFPFRTMFRTSLCFGTFCHGVVIGHACPAIRASSERSYCTHYNPCASALPGTVWSSGMHALHPVPVMSLLHSASKLTIVEILTRY